MKRSFTWMKKSQSWDFNKPMSLETNPLCLFMVQVSLVSLLPRIPFVRFKWRFVNTRFPKRFSPYVCSFIRFRAMSAVILVASSDKTNVHFCYTKARLLMLRYVTRCIPSIIFASVRRYIPSLRSKLLDFTPLKQVGKLFNETSGLENFKYSLYFPVEMLQNTFS